MRRSALLVVTLSWACGKNNIPQDDTDADTDAADTQVEDTDTTAPPPSKDYVVDPDASSTYFATFSMNDNEQTYSFADDVSYSVNKFQGRWYRNYIGTTEVENTFTPGDTDAPATIKLIMTVTVPDDEATPGRHSCAGKSSGFGVSVAIGVGRNAVLLSSGALDDEDPAGPCNIVIGPDSTVEKFMADINLATVPVVGRPAIVGEVRDAKLVVKLKPKE